MKFNYLVNFENSSQLIQILDIVLQIFKECFIVNSLFEESPRWHLGNGNVEKSKSILKKIARTNGHDLGDIELKVTVCVFELTNCFWWVKTMTATLPDCFLMTATLPDCFLMTQTSAALQQTYNKIPNSLQYCVEDYSARMFII